MTKMTETETKVLEYVANRRDDIWTTTVLVSSFENINRLAMRRALRGLQRFEFIQLMPCYDQDNGQLCGSGYCCTDKGHAEATKLGLIDVLIDG